MPMILISHQPLPIPVWCCLSVLPSILLTLSTPCSFFFCHICWFIVPWAPRHTYLLQGFCTCCSCLFKCIFSHYLFKYCFRNLPCLLPSLFRCHFLSDAWCLLYLNWNPSIVLPNHCTYILFICLSPPKLI